MEINLAEIIFALVNFALLLVLLRLFLYKPVRNMLDTRKALIEEGLTAAAVAKEEAAAASKATQSRLDEAQAEANAVIAEARSKAEQIRKQILSEAQAEAERATAQARAAFEKEREEAIGELRKQAAALAINAAAHILAEEINAEQQQALLAKYIAKVGQMS